MLEGLAVAVVLICGVDSCAEVGRGSSRESRMGCVSPMLLSEGFSVIADGTVGTSLSLPSMVAVMPGMSIHRQAIITRQSPAAQSIYSIFYRMVPSNSPEDESDDGSARRSCRHEGRGNE